MVFGCHEYTNGFLIATKARMVFYATNAGMIFVFIRVFVATIFATNAIRFLFVYSWHLISIRSIKKE